MNHLAFDTSTAACAVAIKLADGTVLENALVADRMLQQPAHTTELLPAIGDLLARAGIAFSEIDAIAVGVGPGAFTGLRIGVSTARALATSRDLPLTGVSSLSALSFAAEPTHDGPILPIIDARRNEYFFNAGAADEVGGPEALLTAAAGLDRPLAVGDGAIKLADELSSAGAVVPPAADTRHLVSAAAIIELAAAIEASAVDDIVPNYIRPPDAKVSSRASWVGSKVKS
jgi:tRNA threonylcarbamoyladenosine biosynthesis protein TsaB